MPWQEVKPIEERILFIADYLRGAGGSFSELICGLETTATESARRCFESIFREFGLPLRIRSDNGVPFASEAAGGLSALSIWWIKRGIHPERIQPGRPQQNGQHERMHRTLKQAVTQPVSHSMAAQQRQFNEFNHAYNQQRPHEALQQQTPASQYSPIRTSVS